MTLRNVGPLSVGKLAVLLSALAVTIVGCHKVTGEPCTDNGAPYSNSGVIGGGNIVSHGHKDKG